MLVITYATLREICDLLSSKIYIFLWVLPNCAPSSTQLYPVPSIFTQFISVSTKLSATPSTIFEQKYHMYLGNFPKFRPKNSNLSILTENSHTWYLGGADFESRFRFLEFRPQNPFLGKFGTKKLKLSVLFGNWHTWYLLFQH